MSEQTIKIKDNNIANYLASKNITLPVKKFDYLMSQCGDIYREVKTRSTQRIKLNNNYYFIKKYYPVSIHELIKNYLSFKQPVTDACDEYTAVELVKHLGLKTLDVAAFGQESKRIRKSSFLMTKAIEPNMDMDKVCEQLSTLPNYFKLKRILIQYIASTSRKLHLRGLNHRDYYLCHFLLHLKNITIEDIARALKEDNMVLLQTKLIDNIYLIDLHRMQSRKVVPNKYIIKDLSALLFSVRNLCITRTDKLRFIYDYLNMKDWSKIKNILLNEKLFWHKIYHKSQSLREKG